jgi:hypothetical protein
VYRFDSPLCITNHLCTKVSKKKNLVSYEHKADLYDTSWEILSFVLLKYFHRSLSDHRFPKLVSNVPGR